MPSPGSCGPADEVIAATSVVHNILLFTRDKRIRASKRVPLAT
jgi:predicted nucleic acid-binding protein